LLDRAEDMFSRLRGTSHEPRALLFLLEIYEQEKDWTKAIEVARELARGSGQPRDREIANFYCELAAGEITHGRHDAARGYLEQALATHRKCVRANLLLGEMELARGRHVEAIAAWKRIEAQSPAHLALVAERLLNAYRDSGRLDEGMGLLRGYLSQHPSLDLLNAVFQATLEREGAERAYRLLREELRRTPTLLGLDRLLEAQVAEAPAEKRHELELIKSLVHQHTRSLAMYRCDNCGFKARQFYWRCPACGEWESYPPRRTEERELAA
jgi:lipopolysaccharide biosynthesis regulator YciM